MRSILTFWHWPTDRQRRRSRRPPRQPSTSASSLRPDRGESREAWQAVTCRRRPRRAGGVPAAGACFTDEGYGRFTPAMWAAGN